MVISSRELDDVDLFAAQLADDGLHAHALHADAGADRVDILVAAHDGDLGALAGLAGDGADDDGAVVDFGHFGLEQLLHQLRRGAGDDHLRALGGAVDAQQDDAHALADGELLQARLLALGQRASALPRSKMTSWASRRLTVAFRTSPSRWSYSLEDGVAFGFADLLEDDLLGHLRGDAAERRGVLIEADLAADLDPGREFAGLLEGDLVDGILDLLVGSRRRSCRRRRGSRRSRWSSSPRMFSCVL